MKIFINPGHDIEYDSGAVNPNSGMRECDVVLSIGKKLQEYLEAVGYEVRLLQSDNLDWDSDYDLSCVCDEANDWPADLFISIHCNAANTIARGTEVEVYTLDSGIANNYAKAIQKQIVDSLHTVNRGIKAMSGLIVLKHTNMPALLIETAFIDNDEDSKLLANNQDDFARAIARGITDVEG
jgi:N-acetylmuramoyl-L-alanine amidase